MNTAYGAHDVYLTKLLPHTIDSFKIYLRKNGKDEGRKIDNFIFERRIKYIYHK